MESFQFACPYCSQQFEVNHPLPDHGVACPHCGGAIALPTDVPPPVDATTPLHVSPTTGAPPAAPPIQTADAVHVDAPIEPAGAPTFVEPPAITVNPPASPAVKQQPQPEIQRLSREEKERRRAVRNLVLMAVGVVVLVVAAVVLSRV